MAKKKAGGSTSLGRDSKPKYLGVKRYAGQTVKAGEVLIRQRGTKIIAGTGVKTGRDHTLYAANKGTVGFKSQQKRGFDGSLRKKKIIVVV